MNEYQILRQALNENTVDHSVLEAKAIMADRLKNLKAYNSVFAGVSFSADVICLETNSRIAIA
jgi:hypothetical protein